MKKIREFAKENKAEIIGIKRKYAVLVPIVKVMGEDHILFEIRSETLRNQPGEISFPGGAVEEGETPREAALRETCEEILVGKEEIEYLGEGDIVVNINLSMIYSFIGEIKRPLENIGKNPSEVDEIFTVPLQYFIENEPEIYELQMEVKENPDFPYEMIPDGKNYKFKRGSDKICFYKYEDKIIWGFTAKIIQDITDKMKKQN